MIVELNRMKWLYQTVRLTLILELLLDTMSARLVDGTFGLGKDLDPNFAFPALVSAFLPLPFITSGACKAGTTYKINKVTDLFSHLGELECIFAAGESPTEVGLGYNYGTLLTAANTAWAAPFAAPLYQGDYVVKARCGGSSVNLGTMHVAGLTLGTAVWTIGSLPGKVAAGEYYNDKPSLVMDFRPNVKDVCPVEDPEFLTISHGFLPFKNSLPPVNGFVDIGRVVGRDPRDNGIIFLNKAMASDPVKGFATVLYYAIKNFDAAVNPNFTENTTIKVPESFTYSRPGLRSPLERLPTVARLTFEHIIDALRNKLTSHNPLVPLQIGLQSILPIIYSLKGLSGAGPIEMAKSVLLDTGPLLAFPPFARLTEDIKPTSMDDDDYSNVMSPSISKSNDDTNNSNNNLERNSEIEKENKLLSHDLDQIVSLLTSEELTTPLIMNESSLRELTNKVLTYLGNSEIIQRLYQEILLLGKENNEEMKSNPSNLRKMKSLPFNFELQIEEFLSKLSDVPVIKRTEKTNSNGLGLLTPGVFKYLPITNELIVSSVEFFSSLTPIAISQDVAKSVIRRAVESTPRTILLKLRPTEFIELLQYTLPSLS